jgi:hypothetical protein
MVSAQAMLERDHHRDGGQAHRGARRVASPVAGLQRALGNQGMARALGRKPTATRGTFEHSVRIGGLGPIEVKESNASDWTDGKSGAGDLVLTTVKGKHSDKLKRMADSGERIDAVEVQTVTGQNSWVTVTFKHGLIRGFEVDDKTEHWKLTRFDAVAINRLSIGKPRP